jgi:hypothetical protein
LDLGAHDGPRPGNEQVGLDPGRQVLLHRDLVADGLGGVAQVLGLEAMLRAGSVDDPVRQAGVGPVHSGDLSGVLVHAQVHEPVLVVAMEVADKLPRVREAPAAAGGTACAPLVYDGGLCRTAEVGL